MWERYPLFWANNSLIPIKTEAPKPKKISYAITIVVIDSLLTATITIKNINVIRFRIQVVYNFRNEKPLW